jgi:hypothetical protein
MSIHRQHQRTLGVARRALGQQIEVPQRDDLVTPELDTYRIGHPEAVDIEDSAAHAELRDIVHEIHALEPDFLEMREELERTANIATSQLHAAAFERGGETRALEQCSRRREEQANGATRQLIERLDALAGNFEVGLDLAESFARRIEGDHRRALTFAHLDERPEVGEPSLGFGDTIADHDEKPSRQPSRERRDRNRVGRTGESADGSPVSARGQRRRQPIESREAIDRVQQCR